MSAMNKGFMVCLLGLLLLCTSHWLAVMQQKLTIVKALTASDEQQAVDAITLNHD